MVSPVLSASPGDEGPQSGPFNSQTEAVARYERWGWRIVTDEKRVLVIGDNNVSAIEIDGDLGGEVQQYLAVRLLSGPVVELPGTPTRWLFFASGVEDMSPATFVRIRARRGIVHAAGTFIPLPPSRLGSGAVAWRQPPVRDAPVLPPFHVIAGALRAVTEGMGLS